MLEVPHHVPAPCGGASAADAAAAYAQQVLQQARTRLMAAQRSGDMHLAELLDVALSALPETLVVAPPAASPKVGRVTFCLHIVLRRTTTSAQLHEGGVVFAREFVHLCDALEVSSDVPGPGGNRSAAEAAAYAQEVIDHAKAQLMAAQGSGDMCRAGMLDDCLSHLPADVIVRQRAENGKVCSLPIPQLSPTRIPHR